MNKDDFFVLFVIFTIALFCITVAFITKGSVIMGGLCLIGTLIFARLSKMLAK